MHDMLSPETWKHGDQMVGKNHFYHQMKSAMVGSPLTNFYFYCLCYQWSWRHIFLLFSMNTSKVASRPQTLRFTHIMLLYNSVSFASLQYGPLLTPKRIVSLQALSVVHNLQFSCIRSIFKLCQISEINLGSDFKLAGGTTWCWKFNRLGLELYGVLVPNFKSLAL